MKTLAVVLLSALPLLAEFPWGTVQTQGDVTLYANKVDWSAAVMPDPHTFIYLNVYTPDEACDVYRITLTYQRAGSPLNEQALVEIRAQRYRDFPLPGRPNPEAQVPVHSGTRLPLGAVVSQIRVEKLQVRSLGTQAFN